MFSSTPVATKTLSIPNLISRSPLRRGFTVVLLALAFTFALSLMAQAVSPAPDGGYPGQNVAEGGGALGHLTTGTSNTALGFDALLQDTTGSNNTATGNAALQNSNGDDNTATGNGALLFNTTGSYNTATGYSALYRNTTGYNNTADGIFALFYNTGVDNTATGRSALVNNTIGTDNTAVGLDALSANTAGSFNIALGVLAGSNLTTGSNNINIGAPGVTGESNKIRIGKQGTQNGTFIAGISGVAVTGTQVVVNSSGKLGVAASSARFKEAIKPMDKASEAILSLKPVTFQYKHDIDPDKVPQFGLIAEEVAKVNPDLVVRNDKGEINTVRYEAVNAMLLNEFLKEHRRVEAQEATIAQQKKDFGSELARQQKAFEEKFAQQQNQIAAQQATAAQQQKQIEALTATVRKVSDQVALSKPAPQLVANP